MTSVNTIKTHETPLPVAATFPLREERTGTSRGRFPLSAHSHPVIKEIPSILAPALTQHSISSDVTGTEGLVADTAWTARTVFEQLPGNHLPSSLIADQAMGAPTMSNSIRGLIGLSKAADRLKTARAIDNEDGAIEASIDMAASATQSAFGTTYIGIRSTTIASAAAPGNGVLASAAALLAFIGNVLFVPLFAFLGGWGAFQSYRAHKFYEEYERQGKTFQALVGSVYVSSDKITQRILEDKVGLRIEGNTALDKAVPNKVALCKRYANTKLPEIKNTLLNNVIAEHFAKEYPELLAFKEFYFSGLDKETVNRLDLPTAIGLLLELRKMQLKNEATLAHALGPDCLNNIKKAATRGLEARLASSSPEVRKAALSERSTLLAEVDANYAKNQKVYKGIAIMGIVGVALGILGFFLGGYVGLAVLLGLTLAFAVGSVLFDAYIQGSFTGKPGTWDAFFLKLCIGIMGLSMVGAVGAFLVFGGAPILLGLSLGLGVVLLGTYGYAYYKLKKQQSKWKEDHPEIADLTGRLKNIQHAGQTQLDKATIALFKKLPKETRKGITDAAVKDSSTSAPLSLESYAQKTRFEDSEIEKLSRAVKKTAKFFWTQWWYSNKNEYFKEQALVLEELLASIKNRDLVLAQHAYKKITDIDVYIKLQDNVQRVFKREESVKSLNKAVTDFYKHQFQKVSA